MLNNTFVFGSCPKKVTPLCLTHILSPVPGKSPLFNMADFALMMGQMKDMRADMKKGKTKASGSVSPFSCFEFGKSREGIVFSHRPAGVGCSPALHTHTPVVRVRARVCVCVCVCACVILDSRGSTVSLVWRKIGCVGVAR